MSPAAINVYRDDVRVIALHVCRGFAVGVDGQDGCRRHVVASRRGPLCAAELFGFVFEINSGEVSLGVQHIWQPVPVGRSLLARYLLLVDHFGGDVSALEAAQLLDGSVVGAQVNGLIRVADAVGVVVEADIPPRCVIDEITVLGVGSRRAVCVQFSGQLADLFPSREFFD